jgi:hypothetical protein
MVQRGYLASISVLSAHFFLFEGRNLQQVPSYCRCGTRVPSPHEVSL